MGLEYTHASLFTGIGGFDLAAERNGFKNIFQVEINDYCQQVLNKNFPNTVKYKDIKEFSGEEYNGKITVLSGGFPCQDISVANPNGGGLEGERSGLWYEFYRIIKTIHPKFVIVENSPNLRNKGLTILLKQLAEIGYNAEWEMLQANFFNGHHKRRRLYLVAYTDSERLHERTFFYEFYRQILCEKEANDRFNNLLFQTKQERFEHIARDIRTINDVPNRLDKVGQQRLHALGNAVIPGITEIIFKTIKEVI